MLKCSILFLFVSIQIFFQECKAFDDEQINFKDIKNLTFYSRSDALNINDKSYTLECKEASSSANLCKKYKPSIVECLNLNYEKEQSSDFRCHAKYLNDKVEISDYQVICSNGLEVSKSNDLRITLDSCNLQLTLAIKSSKTAISNGKSTKPKDDKLNVLYFIFGGFLVSIIIGLALGYLSLCIVPPSQSNKKKKEQNLIVESVPDVVMSSSFASTTYR